MDINGAVCQSFKHVLELQLGTYINIYASGEFENQIMPKILISATSENGGIAGLNFNYETIVTLRLISNGNDDDSLVLAMDLQAVLQNSELVTLLNGSEEGGFYGFKLESSERATGDNGQEAIFTIRAWTYLV